MTQPVFKAHDGADLVNMLPIAFGFAPQESLCVLATHGPRNRFGFSARVDLPQERHLPEVTAMLLSHLVHHDADGAIVVSIGEDVERTRTASMAMLRALEEDGRVTPVVIAWADDETVWSTHDPEGSEYERTNHHAAVVQAVVEGRDIVATRADLEARVQSVTGPRRQWLDACAQEAALRVAATMLQGVRAAAPDTARDRVVSLVARGEDLTDGEVLELAVWVDLLPVRDVCWGLVERDDPTHHLALWQRAARLAPRELAVASLCLAAVAAHRLGDGAQMRVALTAAEEIEPEYPSIEVLTSLLDAGIGPAELATLRHEAERRAEERVERRSAPEAEGA